jgi:hypothetical protein
MSTNSFTQKILQANLTLVSGTFDGVNNTKIVSGLRMSAEIDKVGAPSKNTCKLKIYGMNQADADLLTTIPSQATSPMAVHHNLLQLWAGDANGMEVAFQGDITVAYSNYHSAPKLYFSVEATAGYYPSIAPIAPRSYRGGASVDSIMMTLANQMGYQYENTGVTASLKDPYLSGTAMQQVQNVAAAANIDYTVDDGVLVITPRGGARNGTAPLISASSGLIQYPTFDKKGIKFSCLYNPAIKLNGLVNVQSVIRGCSGTWRVNSMKHDLSCLDPGGKWLSKITASWVSALP